MLEKGLADLAEEPRSSLKPVAAEVKAMMEERDRERLHVEHRLLRLESGRHGSESPLRPSLSLTRSEGMYRLGGTRSW